MVDTLPNDAAPADQHPTEPTDPAARRIGRPPLDSSGQRFGKRVVLRRVGMRAGRSVYLARCDCGHEYEALLQTLRRTKGCMKCSFKAARPNRRKRPYEAQYNNFVVRARHPVEITYEQYAEFASQKACHYCDAPITWRKYRGALTNPEAGSACGSNLDRKDHTGAYTADNVVVCCRRCNIAKNVLFTYEEWREIGSVIKEFK